MDTKISSGLKTTFLLQAILGAIFGLVYLFIPVRMGELVDWLINDPEPFRVIGAAILAFTAASIWAYRATTWEAVKIIVQTFIVWKMLVTLVILYGVLLAGLPAFAWGNVVLEVGFAIAFIVFYQKE